ncbi:MAG TPA: Yip1 family protein [Gemmatimonadaceae bacterium]|jgi:hypothetical protein|nr:Yip1 family protein [Gemmatimonadaceae bacterium]
MTESSASAAPTPTDNASMAEDFIDIFTSPAKVFARRAKANPIVPFLIASVVMAILFFASKNALAPIFDSMTQKAIDQAMKSNAQMTPDMADKMRPVMAITFVVGGLIGTPILLLIGALFTWIVGRFFMGGALTYGGALLIASYAFFPKLLGSIVGMVQAMVMDVTKLTSPYQLSISVARLFSPSSMSDGKYNLLGQLDLFSIWCSVLIAIGLMQVAKLEKSKAVTAAVILFVLGCLPALWQVATGK